MTIILTQKRMINNFATKDQILKGEFSWRLKYLKLRAFRNPVDEIAFTAKHKRLLPILFTSRREHEHETLNFLAVIFFCKITSHYQWVGDFVCPVEAANNSSLYKSNFCWIYNSNN